MTIAKATYIDRQWLTAVAIVVVAMTSATAEDATTLKSSPFDSSTASPMREVYRDDDTGGVELRKIWSRLDGLESQNVELIKRNEELQRQLEMGVALPEGANAEEAGSNGDELVSEGKLASLSPGGYSEQPVEMLELEMHSLRSAIEKLGNHLTVTTLKKDYKIILFGGFSGELIFASARPMIPSAVTTIFPASGRNTATAEVHAKSSYLGAAVTGPRMGDFQTGGQLLAFFYGENVLADKTGLFFAKAHGELHNDEWRFALGLDSDVINPLAPTTLNFVRGSAAGNLGYLRSQFRAERYLDLCDERQLTAQVALSDPVVTTFSDFNFLEGLTEDNGWPNFEARLAYESGPLSGRDGAPQRPLGIGLSGVVGQLRRVGLESNAVADVWAIGTDFRFPITNWLGIKGEFFHGQTIGTYNGAVVQNFTLGTREGIRATGGWCEVSVQWTDCFHSHFSCGIDDPQNLNLFPGQIKRNEYCSANILWDITELVDVGFEVSYRETDYVPQPVEDSFLTDNHAVIYHSRVRVKF